MIIAFLAGALFIAADQVGWNYANDSYREMVYQRDILAELITSNDSDATEEMKLENILLQRDDAPFQKGLEYAEWQVSTLFGLYKTSSGGEISDFCFSDVDQDGKCKIVENLDSYVTLRAACEGEA